MILLAAGDGWFWRWTAVDFGRWRWIRLVTGGSVLWIVVGRGRQLILLTFNICHIFVNKFYLNRIKEIK